MKLWTLLFKSIVFSFILLFCFWFWFSNDWESDLDRELIGRVQKWPWTRSVWSVQLRKLKIYKEHKINLTDFLTYEAISQVECWHPLGFCQNWVYVWPFQIFNGDYKEIDEHYRSKDYNSLFAFSIWRMIQKQGKNSGYCDKAKNFKEKIRCEWKIHNGNNTNIGWCKPYKECFADKVWLIREKLKEVYLNKY